MDEVEWLACTDSHGMTRFLRDQASDRKLRLFAVACCRLIWPFLTDPRSQTAVEVAERYADGEATPQEADAALIDAWSASGQTSGAAWDGRRRPPRAAAGHEQLMGWWAGGSADSAAASANHDDAWGAAKDALIFARNGGTPFASSAPSAYPVEEGEAAQADLLRCIFGNPFRPSPPLPPAVLAWNDRTVPRIAQAVYDERRMPEGILDAARLAVLADALLDAGCDDEALLAHCRSAGPHVRGCKAVDAILGKS